MKQTFKKFVLCCLLLLGGYMLHAQDSKECESIVKLTAEAINTNSMKPLESKLDPNFTISGHTGQIAKMILEKVTATLTDKVVSYEKKSELNTDQGLTLIYDFVYDKMGKKETTFEFTKNNLLKKLELFQINVNIRKETIDNRDKEDRTKAFSIPFSIFDSKAIFIQADINGRKLNFIFDTGANATVISSKVAQELGLASNGVTQVTGVSGTSSNSLIRNQHFTIENIPFTETLVVQDLSKFEEYGLHIDGIIGRAIYSKYMVDVNLDTKIMQCLPFNSKPDLEGYKKLDIETKNGLPFITSSFTLPNNRVFNGKVFFDSGAMNVTLIINSSYAQSNNLLPQIGKTHSTLQADINSEGSTSNAAIKSLAINDYTFNDLPVSLISGTGGVIDFDGFMGILGSDIIYRFNFIMDSKTNAIYIKPNAQFNKSFIFPILEFDLYTKDGTLQIKRIGTHSKAYKKGLRENARIISVNGLTDISQIRAELRKENSKAKIVFQLPDESTTKSVVLKLKRLI